MKHHQIECDTAATLIVPIASVAHNSTDAETDLKFSFKSLRQVILKLEIANFNVSHL